MMQENFSELSEGELQAVIKKAEKALQAKQERHRKAVIAQIKELASSIDVSVEIVEKGKGVERKSSKVPVKYVNPDNPSQKWTGRGMKPRWLRELIEAGRKLQEFEV